MVSPPEIETVGLEQLQFTVPVISIPHRLPRGKRWKWGVTPCLKPAPIALDGTQATFTFMGSPFKKAKIQLDPFPIPSSEIDNHKKIVTDYIAQSIKLASNTWGFGFFNFIQSTTDPEFTFEIPALQKVHTGRIPVTEHWEINDSPIDLKRGRPMAETKDIEQAKARINHTELLVQVQQDLKKAINDSNRNDILLAKNIDITAKTLIAKVDDKIAYAIEEFGKVITDAFDKLPDAVAKKLNKGYQPLEDGEDPPGYV